MNILTKVLTAVSLLFTAYACTQDAYDKGDGAYSLMQADLVMAYTNSDGLLDRFVTDDGAAHRLKEPLKNGWMTTPDSAYRAAFYYTKSNDGGGTTTIHRMSRVGVMVPKFITDMKTDPVGIESAWVSKNGQYLNLGLNLKLGSVTDENVIQTLGCHIDSLMAFPDSTRAVRLLLYHDQGGVPEYYSQRAFFSIPVKVLATDTIHLLINTYSGQVERTFVVKR